MEIVKIQMQMPKSVSDHSLLTVVQKLGFKGLYLGVSATLLRDIPFSILFFTVSALLKQSWMTPSFSQTQIGLNLCDKSIEGGETVRAAPPLSVVFFSGLMAAMIGAILVTPMDVVKTRIQASPSPSVRLFHTYRYDPFVIEAFVFSYVPPHCTRTIWTTEGPGAFLRGAIQRCLTISPLFGISLFVYEAQQRWLQEHWK